MTLMLILASLHLPCLSASSSPVERGSSLPLCLNLSFLMKRDPKPSVSYAALYPDVQGVQRAPLISSMPLTSSTTVLVHVSPIIYTFHSLSSFSLYLVNFIMIIIIWESIIFNILEFLESFDDIMNCR